jgi:hypothetical protein
MLSRDFGLGYTNLSHLALEREQKQRREQTQRIAGAFVSV